MADFGKLNFSVALNPTSAFPLDARCYFESLEAAQAAAATAEAAGSTNTVYYYGQKVLVYENDQVTWYTIQPGGYLLADTGASESTATVSLLIDGEEVAVDNISDPEATGEEDEYSMEIQ